MTQEQILTDNNMFTLKVKFFLWKMIKQITKCGLCCLEIFYGTQKSMNNERM